MRNQCNNFWVENPFGPEQLFYTVINGTKFKIFYSFQNAMREVIWKLERMYIGATKDMLEKCKKNVYVMQREQVRVTQRN